MSSEEEMHMLPSFCEGVPSDMSPSEWFGVISVIASGIITGEWRKGYAEAFSWGSNGEKEMLRHFLEIGVQLEKRKCCGIFWRLGSRWRLELKIKSRMRSSGLSSVHVSP